MTFDDLIALNAEISALVRAGVPLDRGLADLGDDTPGRLRQTFARLAERIARGESLDQSLVALAGQMPPAYRAVVQAGVKAGRLPAALEAVASSARRLSETYRAILVAVAYPLTIIGLVWCGLVIFACVIAPPLAAKFAAFAAPGQRFFATLALAGHWAWYWGPVVPVALIVLMTWWWNACTRAAMFHGRSHWLLAGLPWVGRMLRCSRTATFLEILALLIEQEAPLEEAIPLAAEAAGDRRTLAAARQLASALQNGGTEGVTNQQTLPPLMSWLLYAAGRNGVLLPALQHSAAAYHRRTQYQSDMVRIFLPVILTMVVGGGVTAAYALTLFVPYTALFHAMAG